MENKVQTLQSIDNLKIALQKQYINQINNYFGDPKKAMKFLSNVVTSCQKIPELLECESTSVINSFMTMAQLELMPSNVSGEAYVLPYNDKKSGMKIAQFQLGYQGLVTLFYRAGIKSIIAEIVYAKDKFSYINGIIEHNPDVFANDRGEAIGAYVIVELPSGSKINKVMKKDDITGIGKRFSKSFGSSFTPWNEGNDPELWMWRKTVLKQIAKLVPKNEAIITAIGDDNKDSDIDERQEKALAESESMKMGNFIKLSQPKNDKKDKKGQDSTEPAEGGEIAGSESGS